MQQEVKVTMKVVQGHRGCECQKSSCASSLQPWRVSSWLCVCRARCWLTDSPVYPKQQSLTLSWRPCNGIPASTITASTSWTSGLDFTFLYLLLCSTQSSWSCAILTLEFLSISVWEASDQLMQKQKQDVCENCIQEPGKLFEVAS